MTDKEEATQGITITPLQDGTLYSSNASEQPLPAPPPVPDLPSLDFLEQLEASFSFEEDSEPYEDLGDMFETEDRAEEGVWVDWPKLKGAAVKISVLANALERQQELELAYRERKGITLDQPIPPKVSEQIWRECLFGTVIRDWKGMRLGGRELPFTIGNCRKVLELTDFRTFILTHARSRERFRKKNEELTAGN